MPPTWSVVTLLLIHDALPLLPLTIGSAAASTAGRVGLALATRKLGPRFLTLDMRRNMEALAIFPRGGSSRVVLGVVFVTPVSPFPSNQLFLAARLARVDLKLIAPCFFVGRAIEYTAAALAAGRVATDPAELFGSQFSSAPSILLELASLASIVALAKIP